MLHVNYLSVLKNNKSFPAIYGLSTYQRGFLFAI